MKMAKASQQDLDDLWAVFRALEIYRCRDDKRAEQLVFGRVLRVGDSGALFRILGGYETLVANCCDPAIDDVLEFAPRIVQGFHALESQGQWPAEPESREHSSGSADEA